MKHLTLLWLYLIIPTILLAQKDYDSIMADNIDFRKEINRSYADTAESPLTAEDLITFKELPFFDVDTAFYVVAKFTKAKRAKKVKMKTTTDRVPIYDIYGTAVFMINGKTLELNLYQSHSLRKKEAYKDYLFLPFTDLSSGTETYGGGRFIDLKIPEGNSILIDFNQAYNPYCVYNHKYSCPVPPKDNFIDIKVLAGVKYIEHVLND